MRSFLHGAVQLHVLHHAAEHPIHGAWMAAELAAATATRSPWDLYPLHRLEAAGLLSGHDDLKCAAVRWLHHHRRRQPRPGRSASPCANSATNSCRDPRAQRPLPAGDRLPHGVQVGPRTVALAAWASKGLGCQRARSPVARPARRHDHPGGVAQALARTARRLQRPGRAGRRRRPAWSSPRMRPAGASVGRVPCHEQLVEVCHRGDRGRKRDRRCHRKRRSFASVA